MTTKAIDSLEEGTPSTVPVTPQSRGCTIGTPPSLSSVSLSPTSLNLSSTHGSDIIVGRTISSGLSTGKSSIASARGSILVNRIHSSGSVRNLLSLPNGSPNVSPISAVPSVSKLFDPVTPSRRNTKIFEPSLDLQLVSLSRDSRDSRRPNTIDLNKMVMILTAELRKCTILFINIKIDVEMVMSPEGTPKTMSPMFGRKDVLKSLPFIPRSSEEKEGDERLLAQLQSCMEITTTTLTANGGQIRQFIHDDKGTVR